MSIDYATENAIALNKEQDTCITNKYYNMIDSTFMKYKDLAHNNNLDVNEFNQYIEGAVWTLSSWSDYAKAQELLKQAYDLVHNYAHNSPNALRTIEYSMGLVQFFLSDTSGSIKHFLKAKRMFEREKDYTPNYLNCVIYLQKSFLAKGQVGYAKILLDECTKIKELIQSTNQSISNKESDLAQALIAAEYSFLGYTELAQKHLEQLFSKYGDSVIGANWDDARRDLAYIYIKNKEYMKANNLMDKTLQSPSTAENALAAAQAKTIALTLAKSEQAPGFIQATCDYIRKRIGKLLPHFTELDKESYWNQEINKLSYLSYLALNSLFEFDIPQDADLATKLLAFGRPDFASVCINAYNTAIYVKSRQERGIHPTLDWKDIRNMLGDNETAVEFIASEDPHQTTHYAALVLRKDSEKPNYVELCTASELDNIWRDVIHTDTALINHLYGQCDTQLYNLLWKRLEPLLHKGDTIYYSPVGFVSRMNLGAISNGKERMGQNYVLHRLSSTAEISNVKQHKSILAGKAVIYGGLDYNASLEEILQAAHPYTKPSNPTTNQTSLLAMQSDALRSNTRGAVDMLTGTLQEANDVSSMLQSAGFETQKVTGVDGNEESLKALSGHAPSVLHLATHGFFLSNTQDQRRHLSLLESFSTTSSTQQKQAMLYTGLLMSGANHAWTNGLPVDNGLEDGIVTAFEISQIDLTGCKLVVLSACETGIGVRSSDNAYEINIPYALKLANAGTVVASLWEVPDEATSLLMEHFYQGITHGRQPNDALKAAQETVRQVYPQPYYWAAFYAID